MRRRGRAEGALASALGLAAALIVSACLGRADAADASAWSDASLAAAAAWPGFFPHADSAVVESSSSCVVATKTWCAARGPRAVADLCDSAPELTRGDWDGVVRRFHWARCVDGDDTGDVGVSSCQHARQQAPLLCLESRWVAEGIAPPSVRCTCWARRTWRGLSAPPSPGRRSVSDLFPLDQTYPTTPRVATGAFVPEEAL
jgi:hypothetical protein